MATSKRLLIYCNLAVAEDSKKPWIRVEAHDLLLPSAFYFKVPCILEENNWSILINGLCDTLKLVIFSSYVMYVLRVINILKHETFFWNLQKYIGCISIGMQCFHHIHVLYAPGSRWCALQKNQHIHISSNHNITDRANDFLTKFSFFAK
jgi:hypothetical protein